MGARRFLRLHAAWLALALAAPAVRDARAESAESGALLFAPAATRIRFELDSTLHRVVGSARLLRGELHFDATSGRASGSIVVDARSAETGNGLRDGKLHGEVLESERYPEIVFLPDALELTRSSPNRGEVALSGRLRIHGSEHPLRIPARLERDGDQVRLSGHFRVPYVAWGLRDESNFLLHVDPEVEVWIEAQASLLPESAPAQEAAQ